MKTTKKRFWKRRLLWVAMSAALLASVLLWLVFARIHFSYQDWVPLARLHRGQYVPDVRPVIIAHRGAQVGVSSDRRAIGNTASAIERGTVAGIDWIEIDLLRSEDGVLVVFHDSEIDTKTDGRGEVAKMSVAALQRVNVRVERGTEKILTLDEVFEHFDGDGRRWILDIKDDGIEEDVQGWLGEREHLRERVILFGSHRILEDYKDSGYRLGYTETFDGLANRLKVLFTPSVMIDRCERLGCDYLVLPIHLSHHSLVDAATERGIEVWMSGSDDPRDWDDAVARGIRGLLVYEPEGALEHFSQHKGAPPSKEP